MHIRLGILTRLIPVKAKANKGSMLGYISDGIDDYIFILIWEKVWEQMDEITSGKII